MNRIRRIKTDKNSPISPFGKGKIEGGLGVPFYKGGPRGIIVGSAHPESGRVKFSLLFYFFLFAFFFSFSFAQNNYLFGPSIRVNVDPPGTRFHATTQRCIAAVIRFTLSGEMIDMEVP